MALTTGQILADSGAPAPEIGVDGDHYRDTDNQDLYAKGSGIWTLVGNLANGADGVGTTILNGDGNPDDLVGSDGNYYLDLTAKNLWHKVSGIWGLIGSLIGTPPLGTQIGRGIGAPAEGSGEDGYYYLNLSNGDVYYREGGVWGLIGSWATPLPPGTVLLHGAGEPLISQGDDDQYYRNTDNQDIYFKVSGAWTLVGSWAGGGGGGGGGAFEVGTWNMTGPLTPLEQGVVTVGATVGGASPAFTLTPDGSLSGVGIFYASGAESPSGVLLSASGRMFADFIKPVYTAGDNLFATLVAVVNSSATIEDVLEAFQGNTPVNPVWGVAFVSPHTGPTAGMIQTMAVNNGVASGTSPVIAAAAGGDNIGVGIDFDTLLAIVQKGAGTVNTGVALDFTGMPGGDTLKVVHVLMFSASTPVLADGDLVYTPASEVASRSPFGISGAAVPPMGAVDGSVFEVVTSGGTFGGKTTQVGDFVQLFDNTTDIIITRVPVDSTAAIAAVADDVSANTSAISALDGRVDTAETTLIDHGGRIGALEALYGGASLGSLEVENITVPTGHTSTPYELTFPGTGTGGMRRLTINEAGTRIVLTSAVSDGPARSLLRFIASGGMGDDDLVILEAPSGGFVHNIKIPKRSFLKAVVEVVFDGTDGWRALVINLEDSMNVRTIADDLTAKTDHSTSQQVLDITGGGAVTNISLPVPHPAIFPEKEVIVSIIGGGGDSITGNLSFTSGSSQTSPADGFALAPGLPLVPGDAISLRSRLTKVGGIPKMAWVITKLSPNV